MNRRIVHVLLLAALASVAARAHAESDTDNALSWSVPFTAAAFLDQDRDLGLREGGDFNALALDLRPSARWRPEGDWSGFVQLRAFATTGFVQPDRDDAGTQTDGYLEPRQFWIQRSNLLDISGLSVRAGRQRLRDPEGIWWDFDIEALKLSLDRSLVHGFLAVAERTRAWRSDDSDQPPPEEDDVFRVLGMVSWQHQPGHFVEARVHSQWNHGGRPGPIGGAVTDDERLDATWIGVRALGRELPFRDLIVGYQGELIGQFGTNEVVRDAAQPTAVDTVDVTAWAFRGAVSARPRSGNGRLGAQWTVTSAGGDVDSSNRFVPTRIESNRATRLDTAMFIDQFSEALRPELTNLSVFSVFAGTRLRTRTEIVGTVSDLRRRADDESIRALGVSAPLRDGEDHLGVSVDLSVVQSLPTRWLPQRVSDPVVRLRAGTLFTGAAWSEGTDDARVRFVIDVVARF